jgi:hypothetical protein
VSPEADSKILFKYSEIRAKKGTVIEKSSKSTED